MDAPKPKRDWPAIRRQYETSAIGLRQLARNLGIAESTLCQRAWREKWRQNAKLVRKTAAEIESEIQDKAKQMVADQLQPWIEAQKARFTKRTFRLASKGIGRVESMFKQQPTPLAKTESFIAKAAETYTRVGRAALGMDQERPGSGNLNLSILTGQAAVQVVQNQPNP